MLPGWANEMLNSNRRFIFWEVEGIVKR
jgi:hypothetical protein